MKTKNQTPLTSLTVKVAGMSLKFGSASLTAGLDLGDKKHACCVLDSQGKVLKKELLSNERPVVKQLTADWPEALIVVEAGTHNPWISRFFQGPRAPGAGGQSAQGAGHFMRAILQSRMQKR